MSITPSSTGLPRPELQKDQNGEPVIYSALDKNGHEIRNQPMRPEEVADVCAITGAAIEKLIAALPFYADLVHMDPPTQPLDQMARVADHGAMSIVLRTLVREHKRVCTGFNSGAGDNASGTLRWALSSQKSKTKTTQDFEKLVGAMPMVKMVDNMMERHNRDVYKTIEFMRREEEMQAYVEQVKKYGLAGGRQLQEPSEYWKERKRRQYEETAARSDTNVHEVTIEEFMKK